MRYYVTIGKQKFEVDVEDRPGKGPLARVVGEGSGGPETVLDGTTLVKRDEYEWSLQLQGRTVEYFCGDADKNRPITVRGLPGEGVIRTAVEVESARDRAMRSIGAGTKHSGSGVVRSPMPGKVIKILTEVGARVRAGSPVVVVEAMKMENEQVADVDGKVAKIHVHVGDAVEAGAPLLDVDASGS